MSKNGNFGFKRKADYKPWTFWHVPSVNPIVEVEPDAYAVMYYAVQAAKGEVSGLGKVKKIDNEHFVVTEAMIMEQACNSGYTELDDETLSQFIYELAKQVIGGRK